MEIRSKSISKGTGGNYTEWQRTPPPNRIYTVYAPNKELILQVHAEDRAAENKEYPTVQKISTPNDFKTEVEWDDLSSELKEAIQDHFSEKVKTDSWFMKN